MRERSQAIEQIRYQGPVRSRPSPGFRARFAMSRNLHHAQFGAIYERDPEKKAIGIGHFTGGVIYHHDTPEPGRYE